MADAINLAGIEFFLPILSFLLVFTVTYAVLAKTKVLLDNKALNILIAFIVAILFVGTVGAREYINFITPWTAVFIVSAVFVFALIGLGGESVTKTMTKPMGIIIIIGLLILFIVSAYKMFGGGPITTAIKAFVTAPKVFGAIVLIAVGGLTAWILTKAK